MKRKHKIGILGSTGYTGLELVKLLIKRDDIEIIFLASQQYAGKKFSEVYPELTGLVDLVCVDADDKFMAALSNIDLVFFATPNGIAHKYAPALNTKGIHVIDLSADYRFRDLSIYEEWYGFKRNDHELNKAAIYGLVEFKAAEIKKLASKAVVIGNPGCYTTASILSLAPLLEHAALNDPDLVDYTSIIIDGKSAISGAGRKAELGLLFTELNESCSPYNLAGQHRHGPELEVFFSELTCKDIQLSFSPHLVPMSRGLLVTSYINLRKDTNEEALREIYIKRYSNSETVEVLDPGIYPKTSWVSGTNRALVQINYDARLQRVISTCAIDNLLKGAAGQAVENMDLVLGTH